VTRAEQPTDVLPCPICHGSGLVGETLDGAWYAMCADDKCVVISNYFPDRGTALRIWNHRIPAPASAIAASSGLCLA